MFSNTDNANKKYTSGTKFKLFLKWAGVIFFGILRVACFLATFSLGINLWFLLFGHPLNTLIPFLQFLAPVLTSYLWTLLGSIIPFAIGAVFVLIASKIYKLEIKKEFVKNVPLKEYKDNNKNKTNIKEIAINGEKYNREIYDSVVVKDDIHQYYDILNKHTNLNVLFGDENSKERNVQIQIESAFKIANLAGEYLPEWVGFNFYKDDSKKSNDPEPKTIE